MKYLLIFSLWVIRFIQKKSPQQTFTCSKTRIETLKKCKNVKPEQLSTVFNFSFRNILHLITLNNYIFPGSHPVNL